MDVQMFVGRLCKLL